MTFITGLFTGIIIGVVLVAILGGERDSVEMFSEDLTNKIKYPDGQQNKD